MEDATDPDVIEQGEDDAGLRAVHIRALRRFDDAAYPQQEMRRQALEARRFVTIPGAQWEGPWGDQFENAIKIEIDKVGRGLRKLETDYRQNRIVPDFRPDGPDADETTATTLDGLHRADNYRFKSQQARDNAVFEAFAGGFGAYRLCNDWEDEGNKGNDYQRVNPGDLIVDADQSVFFDPNARLYDKSDARFAFIRTALTPDAYEDEYGEQAGEFPDGVSPECDWFTSEAVSVAEYYEVEDKDESLHVLTYRLSSEEKRVWSSDLVAGELKDMLADGWTDKPQRRKRRRVRKYILSGDRVLVDHGYIAGDQIPIVPVYGKRYYVQGVERFSGYVLDKMDAQRLYNSNVSRLAELNSLAPREVPIFAAEQMPPHLAENWARANIDRLPYLTVEPLRSEDGQIVASGPIGKVEPPRVPEALATLIQLSNNDLLEEMRDGSDEVKSNTSAEAMDIAATRVDAKSSIYLDNVRQSVQREGEIYLSMAAEVYVEKGRVVETMSEDGADGEAKLKSISTDDAGNARTVNDLQGARYKVVASVNEATATRRDKTVKSMLATAEVAITAQDPSLAQAALLTAVLNQDGEGLDGFHKWAREKALGLGLVEPNDEEKAAQEAAAQNQQPDPMADLAKAEAEKSRADAAKIKAETIETAADTAKTQAETIKILSETKASQAVPSAP